MFSFFKKKVNNIKDSNVVEPTPVEAETIVKEKQAVIMPGLLQRQSFVGQLEQFSPTWSFIKNHLNNRLSDLRKQNDNVKKSYEKTQVIRGQIKEIKLLCDILDEKKVSKYIEPKE